MFIEKLTHQQIEEFLKQQYPANEGYTFDFFLCNASYEKIAHYHVNIENDRKDYSRCIRLEDFFASGVSSKEWKKYLYQIYGEEYKTEYIKFCLKDLE